MYAGEALSREDQLKSPRSDWTARHTRRLINNFFFLARAVTKFNNITTKPETRSINERVVNTRCDAPNVQKSAGEQLFAL